MKLEIDLKFFIIALAYLLLAGTLAFGFIQDITIDSEIFMFMLSSSSGLLCLVYSIKIKR